MADAANAPPKPKGRGFFEVGMFKKQRVTDAVLDRRMGSEFIVQVCAAPAPNLALHSLIFALRS